MSFYGYDADFPELETSFPGICNPRDLYEALLRCWDEETCAPRLRAHWSPRNPTLGQCSITAFLVQDLFGGRVFGIPRPDGSFHCYNEAAGQTFDLTSEQFQGEPLDYRNNPEQRREDHFSKEEKYERYLLLKQRLNALLNPEN